MIVFDPTTRDTRRSLFLAGGIAGCPDWQAEMIVLLAKTDLIIYNPRHPAFDMRDPDAALRQAAWEHGHLRNADAVLFWFPREALCPIALFELGTQLSRPATPLFIGCDPGYARREDVAIQADLARPGYFRRRDIATTLADLAGQVRLWAAG